MKNFFPNQTGKKALSHRIELLIFISLALFASPAPGEAEDPVVREYFLDCSSGTPTCSGITVQLKGVAPNPQHPQSLLFSYPEQSEIEGELFLKAPVQEAVLEMVHLSSYAGSSPLGGNSRITITMNSHAVVKEWDVGHHAFHSDTLHVGKYLKRGKNHFSIRFVNSTTNYWLKKLVFRCTFPPGSDPDAPLRRVKREPPEGRFAFAVAASFETYQEPLWARVAAILLEKHNGVLLLYPLGLPETLKEELSSIFPRYVCFVAQPEEAHRHFIEEIHVLLRGLDGDPYGDALWGVITGYTPEDALRIASFREPLLIQKGLSGCGASSLPFLKEGVGYSETRKNEFYVKEAESRELIQSSNGPDDTTKALVDALNSGSFDMMWTSGHATERDWQIGYSYPNGQFRCREGQLFGMDTQGKIHPIQSANPKIYFAPGNCLIGNIPGRDCMALAWMRTGGAVQFAGYTVPTWYGFMGWGIQRNFFEAGSNCTFAESFFLTNQQLLFGLQHPHLLDDRQKKGHAYDRDALAFYGDPSLGARIQLWKDSRPQGYTGRVESTPLSGGRIQVRFFVLFNREYACEPHVPFPALLPFRIKDVQDIQKGEGEAIVTDNLILWSLKGTAKEGERKELTFTAAKIE